MWLLGVGIIWFVPVVRLELVCCAVGAVHVQELSNMLWALGTLARDDDFFVLHCSKFSGYHVTPLLDRLCEACVVKVAHFTGQVGVIKCDMGFVMGVLFGTVSCAAFCMPYVVYSICICAGAYIRHVHSMMQMTFV